LTITGKDGNEIPLRVMTKEEGWAAAVPATTRHFGKLDVVVNNAGISGSAEQDF
jgi:NAD(P)-dependent dehydrogenase (short-subunit alcohol dehydrogenase family)